MSDRPVVEGIDASDIPAVKNDHFNELLGFSLDYLSPDEIRAHLDVDERHHQPYGIVHGGVYCTIVESVGSVGASLNAWSSGNVVVGVSNSTDFIRPHRTGRLDAVGRPLHVGRTQQLWEVVVTRTSDGKQVARGQLRLQALPADRELAGKAAAG